MSSDEEGPTMARIVGGRYLEICEDDRPKELFYNAFSAKRSNVETMSWVGGSPLMDHDSEWPTCKIHGDLSFCWQLEEDEETLLLCFMCVQKDDNGWIWPKCGCAYQDSLGLCFVGYESFCYKFIRIRISGFLEVRVAPHVDSTKQILLDKIYLKLEEIQLPRPEEYFEKFEDYYILGDQLVHSDCLSDDRNQYQNWYDAAFLFKTKGIKDQHDIPAHYGYIAMKESATLFPFWSARNPGIFNVSKGLKMIHEF